MKLLKERISREALPRIRYDGLIEYAIPQCVKNDGKSIDTDELRSLKIDNVDYEWIRCASSGSSSSIHSRFESIVHFVTF